MSTLLYTMKIINITNTICCQQDFPEQDFSSAARTAPLARSGTRYALPAAGAFALMVQRLGWCPSAVYFTTAQAKFCASSVLPDPL